MLVKKAAEGFIVSRLNDIICCAKFNQNEKQIRLTYGELPAVIQFWSDSQKPVHSSKY